MTSRVIGSLESLADLHNSLPNFLATIDTMVANANAVYQEMLALAAEKTQALEASFESAMASIEHLRECGHDAEDECSCLAEYDMRMSEYTARYQSALAKIEDIVRPPMMRMKTTAMFDSHNTIQDESRQYADGLQGLITFAQAYLSQS